jgi:hypothetical protein
MKLKRETVYNDEVQDRYVLYRVMRFTRKVYSDTMIVYTVMRLRREAE